MKNKRDFITLIGLILGWGAILAGAKFEGLQFTSLLKLSAFCIVGIGTFAATCVGFTMEQIKKLPEALRSCFMPSEMTSEELVPILIEYAHKARHKGILFLESEIKSQKDLFLRKSFQLLIDGNNIETVRSIMTSELFIWEKREKAYEDFFRSMGGFSPTLGIIGTVMGLIHVMGNLGEPDKIATGISTAFIATFYGISFANLVFLPVSYKLKARREETSLVKEMIIEGAISVGSGDSSLLVMEKLFSYLTSEEKSRVMRKI